MDIIDPHFEWGSLVCVRSPPSVKIFANDLHYDIEVLTKLTGEAKRRQNDNVQY